MCCSMCVFLCADGGGSGAVFHRDGGGRLNQKLIARHPHVYGEAQAADAKAVLTQWEKLKTAEKNRSVIGGLPERLPPLLKAYRLQEKAAAVGFDWSSFQGLLEKLDEELNELKKAIEMHSLPAGDL